MGIFLSQEEIQQITGFKRSFAQVRWLQENGFEVKIRADGSPLVSRSHFELIMGGIIPADNGRACEPDFSAI